MKLVSRNPKSWLLTESPPRPQMLRLAQQILSSPLGWLNADFDGIRNFLDFFSSRRVSLKRKAVLFSVDKNHSILKAPCTFKDDKTQEVWTDCLFLCLDCNGLSQMDAFNTSISPDSKGGFAVQKYLSTLLFKQSFCGTELFFTAKWLYTGPRAVPSLGLWRSAGCSLPLWTSWGITVPWSPSTCSSKTSSWELWYILIHSCRLGSFRPLP